MNKFSDKKSNCPDICCFFGKFIIKEETEANWVKKVL